ncbi:hypothetical protein APR12_000450 [Nocardia amikacinitolerans]|nr:hypothetical protein [Nocardia amikacinitolerans]
MLASTEPDAGVVERFPGTGRGVVEDAAAPQFPHQCAACLGQVGVKVRLGVGRIVADRYHQRRGGVAFVALLVECVLQRVGGHATACGPLHLQLGSIFGRQLGCPRACLAPLGVADDEGHLHHVGAHLVGVGRPPSTVNAYCWALTRSPRAPPEGGSSASTTPAPAAGLAAGATTAVTIASRRASEGCDRRQVRFISASSKCRCACGPTFSSPTPDACRVAVRKIRPPWRHETVHSFVSQYLTIDDPTRKSARSPTARS